MNRDKTSCAIQRTTNNGKAYIKFLPIVSPVVLQGRGNGPFTMQAHSKRTIEICMIEAIKKAVALYSRKADHTMKLFPPSTRLYIRRITKDGWVESQGNQKETYEIYERHLHTKHI